MTTFKPGQHVAVADGTTHVVKSLLQVGTEPLRVVVEDGAGWLASECEQITDPEVAACRIIHATAPVAHCADCGICEDCDVTVGEQEPPDHALCETCAAVADERRSAAVLATAYTTDRAS